MTNEQKRIKSVQLLVFFPTVSYRETELTNQTKYNLTEPTRYWVQHGAGDFAPCFIDLNGNATYVDGKPLSKEHLRRLDWFLARWCLSRKHELTNFLEEACPAPNYAWGHEELENRK